MNCNLAGSPFDHNSNLYGLHQFICEPTRVSNCSSSLIVLVLRMSALVIIAWYMFIVNVQLTWSKTGTARLATEILKVLMVLNFVVILVCRVGTA